MLAVAAVKELIEPCGTFTTPFGYDDDGNLRSFPLPRDYEIGADCAQAMAEGKVITIGGKKRPICTGMILGVSGASMGIGLGISDALAREGVALAVCGRRPEADMNAALESLLDGAFTFLAPFANRLDQLAFYANGKHEGPQANTVALNGGGVQGGRRPFSIPPEP